MKNSTTARLTLGLLVAVAACGCGEYGVYVDDVTDHEMRGILRVASIPTNLPYKVEHSYYSASPPPNNDGFKAYAIHFPSIAEDVLTPSEDSSRWQSGAETNEVHNKALRTAETGARSRNLTWFPSAAEMASDRYSRYFMRTTLQGEDVNPAEFFTYDRQRHILYVVAYKY